MAPDGIVITPEMLDGVSSFQMSGQRDKRARHRPGTSALPAAGPGVGTLAVGPSDSGINVASLAFSGHLILWYFRLLFGW
jgi:hypothetical protein